MARPLSNSESHLIEWLSNVAVTADWRRAGRVLWMRGRECRVAVAFEHSPLGDYYNMDPRVYLDVNGQSLSSVKADVLLIPGFHRDFNMEPIEDALNFEIQNLDIVGRRELLVEFLVERAIPSIRMCGTRDGLVQYLIAHSMLPTVPAGARRNLGI